MKYSKMLALIAGVSLTLSTAALAQSTKAPKAAKVAKAQTSSIKGSVKSVSDSEIVLSQKGKDATFELNSDTKKIGDIQPGAKVAIQYRFDNGKDVASVIKASAAKKPGKGI